MKKIILLLIIFSCSIGLYAQFNPNDPWIKEERGIDYIYRTYNSNGKYYFIRNKANTLDTREPNYQRGVRLPAITVNNIKILDTLMQDWMMRPMLPHIANMHPHSDRFTVYLLADIDGVIKEVMFSVKKEWIIPADRLEKLEKAIKAGKLKLVFNKNAYTLKEARWVTISADYTRGFFEKMLPNE